MSKTKKIGGVMKAIKITTDNEISVVDIHEPTLEGMQEHVGGFIEHVRPVRLYELNVPNKNNLCMIVNEDPYNQELDANRVASELYNAPSTRYWWNILGDVLILAEGFVNGEPDIIGLTDEQIAALVITLRNKFNFLKLKYSEGENDETN